MSILKPDIPSPVTVISSTWLEVYSMSLCDYQKLGLHVSTTMAAHMEQTYIYQNPPAAKLVHFHHEKFEWEKQKTKIVREFMSERCPFDPVSKKFDMTKRTNPIPHGCTVSR